jgi:hypothetical protein
MIWRLYVLTIVLTITKPASGQPNKELCAYLTANSWQEDIHNIANVSFTDSDFYKNQFFLLGEFHGIKYSYDFQAAFLNNLKKELIYAIMLLSWIIVLPTLLTNT